MFLLLYGCHGSVTQSPVNESNLTNNHVYYRIWACHLQQSSAIPDWLLNMTSVASVTVCFIGSTLHITATFHLLETESIAVSVRCCLWICENTHLPKMKLWLVGACILCLSLPAGKCTSVSRLWWWSVEYYAVMYATPITCPDGNVRWRCRFWYMCYMSASVSIGKYDIKGCI